MNIQSIYAGSVLSSGMKGEKVTYSEVCPECDGKGYDENSKPDLFGGISPCYYCDGDGKI